MKIIAALSTNRVIGDKRKIPWFIRGELKRFKDITMGHNVVMGRKTFESIGKALEGRRNIIISNNKSFQGDGAIVESSFDLALSQCDEGKDISSSIESQTATAKQIAIQASTPVLNRMYWLRRHRNEDKLSNQNIKFNFSNSMMASLSKVIPVSNKTNDALDKISDNWSFWSEGSVSVGRVGDTSSSSSKKIDSKGITIGMDKKISENKMYGYALRFGNDYVEYQTFSLEMNPGIRNINLNLGHPDASRLKLIVTTNNWLSLNGDAELVVELIPPLVIPSIILSEVSPSPISPGDSFSIEYILENSGTSESPNGILRVVDVAQPPLVFHEVSIPSIDAGSKYSNSVIFPSWGYSQTTNIEFIWSMDGITVSNQTPVLVDPGSSTSLSLPFSIDAAIYGGLSGLAIVMTCLVIYRVISQRTPSTDSTLFRGNFLNNRTSKDSKSKSMKEVSCPSCSQRLNIPIDHFGAVKCPACSMQFSQKALIPDEEIDNIETESEDEVLFSEPEASSMTDLLSCPQCEQTLRVALDKRPVRSRCPACRVEFVAKIG